MKFQYFTGTRVIFGKNCIAENAALLSIYGKKAFIVTGKHSGKASGALGDMQAALESRGISHLVYDGIENNPSLENVKLAGEAAAAWGADFVIGIGGGSPLDASKAVAVLAVNDIPPVDLYKNVFEKAPLPILAVPTTAGTGSEVTPYSILTRRDMETKMSFGNESTFPRLAFMDARYTESLSREVTVNTAVDALSHAVEGYLSKRSTPVSDALALEAIGAFGECIPALTVGLPDFDIREKLLYLAMLGGLVITHTGTTIVHGLGYSLTYFKDFPHGKANGMLMKAYFEYNYPAAEAKIDKVLQALVCKDIHAFGSMMGTLLGEKPVLSEGEIEKFAALAIKQRSASYNIREVGMEDLKEVLRNSVH